MATKVNDGMMVADNEQVPEKCGIRKRVAVQVSDPVDYCAVHGHELVIVQESLQSGVVITWSDPDINPVPDRVQDTG